MKRNLIDLKIFIISGCLLASPVTAGEFYAGYRIWTADWQPGYIAETKSRVQKNNLLIALLTSGSGETLYSTISTATHSTGGMYSGPYLTYITDDRKWSFSGLIFSGQSDVHNISYTDLYQKTPVAGDPTMLDFTMNTGYNIRPTRYDYDFTAGYALTEHFKLFGGLKFQGYDYNSSATSAAGASFFDPLLLSTPVFLIYTDVSSQHSEEMYSGPVMGVAYSVPISDTAAVAFSLGIFDANGESTTGETTLSIAAPTYPAINYYITVFKSNWYQDSIKFQGITYELSYTGRVSENLLMQIGWRGQRSNVVYTPKGPQIDLTVENGGTTVDIIPNLATSKATDVFQGFNVGIAYKLQ